MLKRLSTDLLAIAMMTGASYAGPVMPALGDINGAALVFVQDNTAAPTIAQLKARQEARIRLNEQLQILKKMQIDQALLQVQQRKMMEQNLKRQTTRSRNRQIKATRQETAETQKRAILQDELRSGQNQTVQRRAEVTNNATNQRNRQEQSIKEKYLALQRYYESLARRALRAQSDRIAAPKIPPSQ